MNWDEHRQECRAAYKKARSKGSGFGKEVKTHPNKEIKEATSIQIETAKRLGINLPKDISRRAASKIITEKLNQIDAKKPIDKTRYNHRFVPDNKPTPKQLLFATDLGIIDPETYNRKELSNAIDFKIMERSSAKRTA